MRWFNGEEIDTREKFSTLTTDALKINLGNASIIVIDEAQRIESIGLVIKLLVDKYPELKIFVTGSASLELAAGLFESMTGRAWTFSLFPISFEELVGSKNLTEALRLGGEVSYHELGQLLQTNPETIERYIDLLEKAFVIFRLQALSRNKRNEIKKGRKIYFLDLGIRNALVQNFAPLKLRNDIGGLWENFCILERMKTLSYHEKNVNRFFWRTHTQQEIDYIEEYDGNLHAYEFKWNPKAKNKIPKSFLEAYPGTEVKVIHPENIHEFAILNQGD